MICKRRKRKKQKHKDRDDMLEVLKEGRGEKEKYESVRVRIDEIEDKKED